MFPKQLTGFRRESVGFDEGPGHRHHRITHDDRITHDADRTVLVVDGRIDAGARHGPGGSGAATYEG